MDPSQGLYNAAATGDTSNLNELLGNNNEFILDRCISEGRYTKSPLHVAADAGHVEFTRKLLRRKPELAEVVDQVKMWSPLHAASAKGHLRIIRALIRAKPRMCFAYDRDGMTPIHIAVVNKHLEALQIFLENQPFAVREPTARGETVLHLCAKYNLHEVLKSLLAAAGITDENGNNADLPPAADGQVAIDVDESVMNGQRQNNNVRDLQERPFIGPPRENDNNVHANPGAQGEFINGERQNNNGGDLRSPASMCLVRDQNGRTPIHVAAANGHVEVLKLLHRANRYAARERNNNGETILHLCVKHSQLEALKTLIELNKDDGDQLINYKDNNGNTILHLAVSCNQLEMVRYLVKDCRSRIRINAVNNKDMTVMDLYNKQKEKGFGDITIGEQLTSGKAKQAMELADRFENERSALLVVASLLATIAFQVGTNPPGGVYPDTEKGDHEAGLAIWSYRMFRFYGFAEEINTVAFGSSVTVILILICNVSFTRESTVRSVRIILMVATISTWGTFCVVSARLAHGTDRDAAAKLIIFILLYVFLAIGLLFVTFERTIRSYCKNSFNRLQVKLTLNRGEEGRPPNAGA